MLKNIAKHVVQHIIIYHVSITSYYFLLFFKAIFLVFIKKLKKLGNSYKL